ncbi:Monooxygenase 1 [Camellia lanceoleosa]|uniref:Monooxygenase 1 n=1 Tax=Camellia lanceoleosa TaxID=1840588 RepID=A0ACC0GTX7_9ERIC|nr:Monooxygenase 1 [Camellia lanceoleosa]
MLEMIQNCDVDSVTFNGIRYRVQWELLNARFRKGTVTVAGDAMHVMGPFLRQGGSIALEDAIVLARCLATQRRAEVALDQYIGERRMRLVQISTKNICCWDAFRNFVCGCETSMHRLDGHLLS